MTEYLFNTQQVLNKVLNSDEASLKVVVVGGGGGSDNWNIMETTIPLTDLSSEDLEIVISPSKIWEFAEVLLHFTEPLADKQVEFYIIDSEDLDQEYLFYKEEFTGTDYRACEPCDITRMPEKKLKIVIKQTTLACEVKGFVFWREKP